MAPRNQLPETVGELSNPYGRGGPMIVRRAFAHELDKSNPTGSRRGKWGAREHGYKPEYMRQYVFPLPFRGFQEPYNFMLEPYRLGRLQEPITEFRNFVRTEMNDQITSAVLWASVLDIDLTAEAHTDWQTNRPETFYSELGRLYMAAHQDVHEFTIARLQRPSGSQAS